MKARINLMNVAAEAYGHLVALEKYLAPRIILCIGEAQENKKRAAACATAHSLTTSPLKLLFPDAA